MKDMNPNALGYVVVTDYLEANTGKDVSDAIQKVIDENPMRTIYFPDGEYVIAKPICTSAKPENAVSLHLSSFAIIKAADGWNHTEAMIRLGGAEPYNTIYRNGSNYYFCGGIVDGNMVANGISIDSGRETSVRNVSIKHTVLGLHIKRGANNGASDADIEAVHIVGNNRKNSIGFLIEGTDNTASNMRIAGVQTGVLINSSGNCLRNIHPLFVFPGEYGGDASDIDFTETIAFDEQDHGCFGSNWYDFCYSDQLATGFKLCRNSNSVFTNCFVFWYTEKGGKQVAFECQEAFNASITSPKVYFRPNCTQKEFLVGATKGGNGFVANPNFAESLVTDRTYKDFLVGKVIA